MISSLLQACIAFSLTLLWIIILSPMAIRIGLVDAPNQRKQHEGEIPIVGGIAIFLTLIIAAALWGQADPSTPEKQTNALLPFLTAGGLLVVIGILDDRLQLTVLTRILAEVAVAVILVESLDLRLSNLGDLLGTGAIKLSGYLAYIFTVLVIFVVVNAYNMLDGMDGLLGIIVMITILAFHVFTGLEPGLISITVIASLTAFLVSNLGLVWFIPKSFLGDAGSKLLGLIVVALVLLVTSRQVGNDRIILPATALYLLGLPLFDMAFTTLRRLARRKSPVRADNTHIHHLLHMMGLSGRRSLLLIGSLGLIIPSLGLMLARAGVAESQQFGIFVGCFAIYCIVMSQAWHVAGRWGRRGSP
tara:strand:+ start:1012 stop:2091 length:1080 start_codon:yes stop_codon:yes gene_type:complete